MYVIEKPKYSRKRHYRIRKKAIFRVCVYVVVLCSTSHASLLIVHLHQVFTLCSHSKRSGLGFALTSHSK